MRWVVPDRFSVTKILREGPGTRTAVATDLLWNNTEVIVKLFKKGHFSFDRTREDIRLSAFIGMKHENIVPILEAGCTRFQDLYITRKYLPARVAPLRPNIDHIRSLISTVQFLNATGCIHGAIKPSNVFFLDDCIQLLDPRIFDLRSAANSEGEIRFSAPEVLRGGKDTRESDLYSLGAVLYRWIVGQDPFQDSEIDHLKLKYIWASPQPIANGYDFIQMLPDAILALLDKDPHKRLSGFNTVASTIQPNRVAATQAPFVGHKSHLNRLRTIATISPRAALTTVVIEGPRGIGKSRFVEELRTHCSLDSVDFVFCNCKDEPHPLSSIASAIHRLVRFGNDSQVDSRKNSEAVAGYIDGSFTESPVPKYPIERLTSDLVGLLALAARSKNIVFVIDDIDQAQSAAFKFLEQLCCRAAEVPMALILTCQSLSSCVRLESLLKNILGEEVSRIRLSALDLQERSQLFDFLGVTNTNREFVVTASGGNPFFFEQYLTHSSSRQIPQRVREIIGESISRLAKDSREVAEVLSLFDEPAELETLERVCDADHTMLSARLTALETAGLVVVSTKGLLLHPAANRVLLQSLKTKRLLGLNRRAFLALQSSNRPARELARWSFEGKVFHESSLLYSVLADQQFDKQNFRDAAFCYEQVERCFKRGATELSLLQKERMAKCYHRIGKLQEARELYEGLLRSDVIRNDPESLSRIYSNLGFMLDKTKADVRIAFAKKAVENLPADSSQLCLCYVQLCKKLLHFGDIRGATEALDNAIRCNTNVTNVDLEVAKASLFLNKASFRAAANHFNSLRGSRLDQLAIAINIGLCSEHLGDLSKAKRLFEHARQLSGLTGHLAVHVFSLSNLGCISTKKGDLVTAQTFHADALRRVERLRGKKWEFDSNSFMSVYADAAVHHMHTADFKTASKFVRRLRPTKGWVFALDRIFCELVKCEFFIRLGQRRAVEAKLASLSSNSVFESPFFEVERTIIESRIDHNVSQKTVSRLTESLEATDEMGTVYQQCALLNELARVSLEINDPAAAAQFAKRALDLARRNHYRLLGARALLLAGMSAEVQAQKQRYLYSAFQEASEMGLRELIAESAFEIGAFQLSLKNWVTAQEYLMRCISVTEEIAEGVPERYRAGYMNLSKHRLALQALKVCNPEVQKLLYVKAGGPDFGNEKRYFAGLYQLTSSANSASSVDVVVNTIADVLAGSMSRSAVVVLKHRGGQISKVVRTKNGADLVQRAEQFLGRIKDRIYLGATEAAPHKPIAWIPLESPIADGGVYVACGTSEATFTEKEIEFLTMVGTIGSSALDRIESRKREEIQKNIDEFHGMIGASKAINHVFSQIQVAASNAATVLIEGESGTGKELVAKAIHAEGARAKAPFIAVDCGAIPESLIEAELFGAKKGSYTGAVADRPGLFEAAHRGTIFLDEISNTAPALQAKLLRVIQEREVRRIGETKGRSIDVRLIVASNQNLEALAENGTFRKDLLYRLKVLHITLPPLRNRRDDISMLSNAFLQKLNAANKTKKYFASDVLSRLTTYDFPGNVRELQNAIERAFFSARASVISDIPLEAQPTHDSPASEDVQAWFKDLSEGRKDFWSAVHNKYKRRDISREKVLALVDFGLRSTRGNYKTMAAKLRLKEKDYRRFMDFLRRSECLLDFRPYRKLAAPSES